MYLNLCKYVLQRPCVKIFAKTYCKDFCNVFVKSLQRYIAKILCKDVMSLQSLCSLQCFLQRFLQDPTCKVAKLLANYIAKLQDFCKCVKKDFAISKTF
jgi:hypothetical protein